MTHPLDPADDPDRYDPSRESRPPGPLDWALDPDRYDAERDSPAGADVDLPGRSPLPPSQTAGRRATLPELIGKEASFQDSPSPYIWLIGLAATAVFLLLVAFIFAHLHP